MEVVGGSAGVAECGGGSGGEPETSDSPRTFGAVVQELRGHAGLSREEFGSLVRFSKHTVASVELGRRMPDPAFVERADVLLGGTGALLSSVRDPEVTEGAERPVWSGLVPDPAGPRRT